MEKIKEMFEKYKDKDDCDYNEFLDLYDSLLIELNKMNSNFAMELRNMYNHEYAIVKCWTTSNGSEQIYDKERLKGFNKMKTILKQIMSENKCNN